MEKEYLKREYKVENDAFKERFQFLLSVNDNIICQRYFKINGYNPKSLQSLELKYTLDECIEMIKEDLVSKSRIFMWYTRDEPIKMTGFGENEEVTYFKYDEGVTDSYSDNEKLNPYEVTFKFQLLVDEKVVYEIIWDGTDYPKYVRNGVDLTNSDALYKDKEPLSLHFSIAIVRRMTLNKIDLVYHIIKKICEAMSCSDNSYTNSIKFTNRDDNKVTYSKDYALNLLNRDYYNGWRNYVKKKTEDYFSKKR